MLLLHSFRHLASFQYNQKQLWAYNHLVKVKVLSYIENAVHEYAGTFKRFHWINSSNGLESSVCR
jgi:hypothetical protein